MKDFSYFIHSMNNTEFAQELADKVSRFDPDMAKENPKEFYDAVNQNAVRITLALLERYHKWVSEE